MTDSTVAYEPGDENVPGTFAHRVKHMQPVPMRGQTVDFRNGYYRALADVLAALREVVKGD